MAKSYWVEYRRDGRNWSSRITSGIKTAERIACEHKLKGDTEVFILGTDGYGHRTLEQRV